MSIRAEEIFVETRIIVRFSFIFSSGHQPFKYRIRRISGKQNEVFGLFYFSILGIILACFLLSTIKIK